MGSVKKKWVNGKLNNAFFFFFCQIFGIVDDFLKFHIAFCMLHFKKSQIHYDQKGKEKVQKLFFWRTRVSNPRHLAREEN